VNVALLATDRVVKIMKRSGVRTGQIFYWIVSKCATASAWLTRVKEVRRRPTVKAKVKGKLWNRERGVYDEKEIVRERTKEA